MATRAKAANAQVKLSTEQVREALVRRYPEPEWVLLHELRNQTGYAKQERYADAVAFNMYPSRGQKVVGFEIKVSRADFKKELASPDKSAAIQRFCDHWYVVLGAADIYRPDEDVFPPTWGLLVPAARGGLVEVKAAPQLDRQVYPHTFIMALLRNAAKSANRTFDQEYHRGYTEGLRVGSASTMSQHARSAEHFKAEHARLLRQIQEFAEKTGVDIREYQPHRVFNATLGLVRRLLAGRATSELNSLLRVTKAMAADTEKLAEELAALDARLQETGDKSAGGVVRLRPVPTKEENDP